MFKMLGMDKFTNHLIEENINLKAKLKELEGQYISYYSNEENCKQAIEIADLPYGEQLESYEDWPDTEEYDKLVQPYKENEA